MLAVVAAMVAVLIAAGPGIGGTLRDMIASIFGGGQSGGGSPVDGGPLAGPAGPLPPIDYDGPSVPDGQTYGGGTSPHGSNPTGQQSDPVNSATGAWISSGTDLALPGPGVPFQLVRSYNSGDRRETSLGVGWTHTYEMELRVDDDRVTFIAEDGQRLPFADTPGGLVGAPGVRSELARTTSGGFRLTTKDDVQYDFSYDGSLQRVEDRNGVGVDVQRDDSGRVSAVVDDADRSIVFAYENERLRSVTLPDGRSVSYSYSDAGRLVGVTDPEGETARYEYNGDGRVTRAFAAGGDLVVANRYGDDGRVIEQVDARGETTSFDYDDSAQRTTMTDANGGAWTDVYRGNVLVRRIDPLGNALTFDYDGDLNLVEVINPRGSKFELGYDADGNINRYSAPPSLGYSGRLFYDDDDNLVRTIDAGGNTTRMYYDARGNVTRVKAPDGAETNLRYDVRGLVTSVTDARGNATRMFYDETGNLVRTVTAEGSVTRFGYDEGGRMIRMIDPRGTRRGVDADDFTWMFEYDDNGRLVEREDPLGNRSLFEYDAGGRLRAMTDPENRTTTYSYDPLGHLARVEAADGTETRYAYDAAGNLVRRTDARGHITSYSYDELNRVTKVTTPTDATWTYGYDSAGNLISMTDANGNATSTVGDGVIRMTYDALNRPTAIDYPGSSHDVRLDYDPLSRVSRMTDGLGSETYRFDEVGRLTRVARGGESFFYRYDVAGNLLSRRYPDGATTRYTYDADNRLTSSDTPDGRATYSYDAASQLTQVRYPNGFTESSSYDAAGRVDELKHERGKRSLYEASYTYDGLGNPATVDAAGTTTTYGYDELHRLTEACFDSSCEDYVRYSYDEVGNRTEKSTPSGTTNYTYDAADRLASQAGPEGDLAFRHDDNGNLVSAGSRSYSYDETSHLAAVTADGSRVTYTYDGAGRRLTRSAGGDTTRYSWDPNHAFAQLALEHDDEERRRYSYGHDLLSVRAERTADYYHDDRLGSVVGQSSRSGAIESRYVYGPYGESAGSRPDRAGKSGGRNPMRFTGEYLDESTGLYHLRARDYDPELGRFLQPDPLPLGPSAPYVSPYAYAYNRPTYFVDPSGMFGLGDITDAVGDAAGAVGDAVGDAAGAVGDAAGDAAGAVGDFVVEHRHDIVDFAVGAGAAVAIGACVASVACGVAAGAAIAGGALAAGVGLHYGADAVTGQDSGSFGEYLTRSAVSTGFGVFCGVTVGAGCGGQVAMRGWFARTGSRTLLSGPLLSRIPPRLTAAAMGLSFGQVALRGGAGIVGRALANWATGVPSWLQTAPYESTSSSAGGK
jgi:RHS repeat-associated protein